MTMFCFCRLYCHRTSFPPRIFIEATMLDRAWNALAVLDIRRYVPVLVCVCMLQQRLEILHFLFVVRRTIIGRKLRPHTAAAFYSRRRRQARTCSNNTLFRASERNILITTSSDILFQLVYWLLRIRTQAYIIYTIPTYLRIHAKKKKKKNCFSQLAYFSIVCTGILPYMHAANDFIFGPGMISRRIERRAIKNISSKKIIEKRQDNFFRGRNIGIVGTLVFLRLGLPCNMSRGSSFNHRQEEFQEYFEWNPDWLETIGSVQEEGKAS